MTTHRPECDDPDCLECVCGWLVPEDVDMDDVPAAHRAHAEAAAS